MNGASSIGIERNFPDCVTRSEDVATLATFVQ